MNCCDYTCTQSKNCPVRTYRLSTPAELMAMAGPEPILPAPDWLESLLYWLGTGSAVLLAVGAVGYIFREPLAATLRTFLQLASNSGLG